MFASLVTGKRRADVEPPRQTSSDNGKSRRLKHRFKIIGLQIAVGVAALALWQFVVTAGIVPVIFISTPVLVWEALVDYALSGELWSDSAVTIFETLVGFIVGSIAGILAGLLLGRYVTLSAVLGPYLTALNSMPRVALAPMFILWFGIGMESKIYLAISVVFFIVLVATESGVRTVDPDFVVMGKSIGASQRTIFRTIVLPASIPSVFAGLKLGAVYALLAGYSERC